MIIDEASLLRLDVFAELHTITQFEADSKPYLPMVLAGQNNLADNLLYRTAVPLASRIVARSHLQAVDRQGMQEYIDHHLTIAGLNNSPLMNRQSPLSIKAPAACSERQITLPEEL